MNPPTKINPVFTSVQTLLSDITGVEPEEITAHSYLREDLNMTPMELAQFLAAIESKFGVRLDKYVLGQLETIDDLVAHLEDSI